MDRGDTFLLGAALGLIVAFFFCFGLFGTARDGQCAEACAPRVGNIRAADRSCWCEGPDTQNRVVPKTWTKP